MTYWAGVSQNRGPPFKKEMGVGCVFAVPLQCCFLLARMCVFQSAQKLENQGYYSQETHMANATARKLLHSLRPRRGRGELRHLRRGFVDHTISEPAYHLSAGLEAAHSS